MKADATAAVVPSDKRGPPLCRYFNTPKGCASGDACRFAHHQVKNTKQKNKPAAEWLKGTKPCRYGANCRNESCNFAHPPPFTEANDDEPVEKNSLREPFLSKKKNSAKGPTTALTKTAEKPKKGKQTKIRKCRFGSSCRTRNCKYAHPEEPKDKNYDPTKDTMDTTTIRQEVASNGGNNSSIIEDLAKDLLRELNSGTAALDPNDTVKLASNLLNSIRREQTMVSPTSSSSSKENKRGGGAPPGYTQPNDKREAARELLSTLQARNPAVITPLPATEKKSRKNDEAPVLGQSMFSPPDYQRTGSTSSMDVSLHRHLGHDLLHQLDITTTDGGLQLPPPPMPTETRQAEEQRRQAEFEKERLEWEQKKQQEAMRKAEFERERLEQERLNEQRRLEQKQKEEKARLEQAERLKAERLEKARIEAEQRRQEEQRLQEEHRREEEQRKIELEAQKLEEARRQAELERKRLEQERAEELRRQEELKKMEEAEKARLKQEQLEKARAKAKKKEQERKKREMEELAARKEQERIEAEKERERIEAEEARKRASADEKAKLAKMREDIRKQQAAAKERKKQQKSKKQERRLKELEEQYQKREASWVQAIDEEKEYVGAMMDLCAAEFVRQNKYSPTAIEEELTTEKLKSNKEALEKLRDSCRVAYRALFQDTVESRVVVAGLDKDMNDRTGTIRFWDETKDSFSVGLDTKKGNVEIRLIKPGNLEVVRQSKVKGKREKPIEGHTIEIPDLCLDLAFSFDVTVPVVEYVKSPLSRENSLQALMHNRHEAEKKKKQQEEWEKQREEEDRKRRAERKARENAAWEERKKEMDREREEYAEFMKEVKKERRRLRKQDRSFFHAGFQQRCNCERCQFEARFRSSPFFDDFFFAFDEEYESDEYENYFDERFGGFDERFSREREEELAAENQNQADTLGVAVDASPQEIKRVYRSKALQYHPDKYREESTHGLSKDEATEHFKELQNAYDHLMSNFDDY